MFGRKNETEAPNESQSNDAPIQAPRAAETHAPRTATPQNTRRVVDMPSTRRQSSSSNSSNGDERRLTVGKGLSLAGEIASCDILVVEGKVEARLSDGKLLEITEAGQFRGSVEIENADIAGRFDGELVVHGRLTVRSTGRVSGTVRYSELEISAGGQIIGELQVVGAKDTADVGSFKTAARYAASGDDTAETTEAKAARKSA